MPRAPWLDVDWSAHRRSVTVDGAELAYVDIGSGPAIVWIHGLGGAWQNWLENLPVLADAGFRCIAPDLPGFGGSEALSGDVTIERLAAGVGALLDALEVADAVLVGNSMGGFIALELALRRRDLVRSLVLVSAAVFWQEYRRARPLVALANVTESVTARALAGGRLAFERRPRLRTTVLELGGVHDASTLSFELQQELIATSQRTPGYVPALRALASYPLRDELRSVSCPTLIVWGAEDPLVSVRHADELLELIPDAQKVVYERTGHLAMLEQPARFNADVAAFVRAAQAAGGVAGGASSGQ